VNGVVHNGSCAQQDVQFRVPDFYGTSLVPMSAIAHLADLQSQFQYVAKVPSPASY
jgi:hypothetical protein